MQSIEGWTSITTGNFDLNRPRGWRLLPDCGSTFWQSLADWIMSIATVALVVYSYVTIQDGKKNRSKDTIEKKLEGQLQMPSIVQTVLVAGPAYRGSFGRMLKVPTK